MKRLLIIISIIVVGFAANAKSPQISVEQFFDGRFNKEKTVSTSISKDNGLFYRILKVMDNPAIVKEIVETLLKDKSKAKSYTEQIGEGGRSVIVKIINNGETINIGFQEAPSGKSATLIIKGPEKAFK